MSLTLAAALLVGSLTGPSVVTADTGCDRACLAEIMNTYLQALTDQAPGRAPVSEGYRATEDAMEVRLGEGLWQTATGLGSYRIDMADPVSGNVGFIGEILEGEGRVTIALRLKVTGRRITEIETILGRGRVPGSGMVASPRPSLSRTVPASERLSRDEMIATADANFDAILAADGSIYADDCQRIENRMAMSGNPELDYPIATIPGVEKPRFGIMGCREQIEHHLFDQLDEVEPRRFVLVDEEKQLVFGVYMMRWYKKRRCSDIPDYGRICPETPRTPVALLNAELLGVRGGQIHEIEAIFKFADYDSDSGWQGDLRSDPGSSRRGEPVPVRGAANPLALLQHDDPRLAANKRLVFDMWRGVVNAGHVDLADELLTEDYIQHSPVLPTGRAAFKQTFSAVPRLDVIPDLVQPPLVHIIAEGDSVVMTLLESVDEPQGDGTYTSTHFNMFRVEDGRLAEHWHSVQTAPGPTVLPPEEGGPQLVAGATGLAQLDLLAADEPTLAANKRLVFDMWRHVIDAGREDLVDRYFDPSYVDHDATVETGLDALKAHVAEQPDRTPQATLRASLVAVVAENDLVAVVTGIEHPHPSRPGNIYTTTWFDMYRVQDGRITEHWNPALKQGSAPAY